MSRDHKNPIGLQPKELEGFLQLLLASEKELPEPTPEIIAYLERTAAREPVDPTAAAKAARNVCRTLIAERLRATVAGPIRPLGLHLRAKRVAAKCEARQIALALGEDELQYERLEAGRVSPLQVSSESLARIVRVFGLSMTELREAIRLFLNPPEAAGGIGFASGGRSNFTEEQVSIAADDLLRAVRDREEGLSEETMTQIDAKMSEVEALLARAPEYNSHNWLR